MSILRSEPLPILVRAIEIIFASICCVSKMIWLTMSPLEFFPDGVSVSYLTRDKFKRIGIGSPLFDNLVICELGR